VEENELKKASVEHAGNDGDSSSETPGFGSLYQEFRERLERDNVELDPDEIFADVRDRSPGRDFEW
jgi:hypothetical protein